MKRYIQNRERGIGKITLLVFGLVFGVAGYCAWEILPFYYYYYELVSQMQTVIRVASTDTDQEIRQKLMYHIKKFEIPADPEDLKISRDGHTMSISLPYEEVFYLTYQGKDYDIYKFPFFAQAEGKF